MIHRLARRHPDVPTFLIVTGNSCVENPKIHKLSRLEPLSRGELFWVTDSNIRVDPGTLSRLAGTYLAKDAKIVFSPIRGTSSRSLGSLMDTTGLNFFTSGNIMSAWALLGLPIIVGKSMLIERAALDTFAGFAYFKNYLAEDFLLRFPAAVVLKDLLLFGVYLTPFFSRSVRWRREKIGIGRGTLIALPHNVDDLVHEGA